MFLVIGTTTVDLYVSGLDRIPRFDGDEFTANSLAFCSRPLTMALGGNGANSAYVLATLGADVALVSAAGYDTAGDLITGWLREKKIDLRGFVRTEKHGSATNTVVMDDRLNRISFYHPGPLHDLKFEDLPVDLFHNVKALLVTGWPLLPGFRPDGFASALKAAKANQAVTLLDIGPAIQPPAKFAELVPVLPLIDYLLTNEYELGIATDNTDVEAGIRQFQQAGANAIVLKRGKDGATIYRGDERIEVPGFPVEATVTVGAGDSFNSGFLFALGQGKSPLEAATFGSITASRVVASGKSVLGAPTRAEVEALMS
jgi:sugar/nucleoside kinase (ribokinase family)